MAAAFLIKYRIGPAQHVDGVDLRVATGEVSFQWNELPTWMQQLAGSWEL